MGGEKENTAVHVMNTLCDTCCSQRCLVKKRERERERKNPLHLPHFKPFSIPPLSLTSSHPTPHPASVSVSLYFALLQYCSSEHVVLFLTLIFLIVSSLTPSHSGSRQNPPPLILYFLHLDNYFCPVLKFANAQLILFGGEKNKY